MSVYFEGPERSRVSDAHVRVANTRGDDQEGLPVAVHCRGVRAWGTAVRRYAPHGFRSGPLAPHRLGGVGNPTLSPPLNFNGARWGDGGSSCILFGRGWGTTGGEAQSVPVAARPRGGGVPSNGSGPTPLQPCLGPRTPLRHCPGPLSNSPLSTAPTFRPPSSAPLPWAISKPRNSSPNCSQTTKLPTSIRGPDSRRRVASSRWRRWIAHIKGLGQAPVY